jgi:hypothetical protein
MAWASMFEDIQERRDEAEHYRRAAREDHAPELVRRPRRMKIDWKQAFWGMLRDGGLAPIIDTVVSRHNEKDCTGLATVGTVDKGGSNGSVQFNIQAMSQSGGKSRLSARVGPRGFRTIIQAMLVANPQVALDIMTEELRREAPTHGVAQETTLRPVPLRIHGLAREA